MAWVFCQRSSTDSKICRWSNQKGVDAIADVFPSIMERDPRVQLICVGPVIDLYGRFAAIKLARMMGIYPGRVFSQPEFTALPPYIFSGADFALMPSRDEPFGLVAVEFGRKGVLCVGAYFSIDFCAVAVDASKEVLLNPPGNLLSTILF